MKLIQFILIFNCLIFHIITIQTIFKNKNTIPIWATMFFYIDKGVFIDFSNTVLPSNNNHIELMPDGRTLKLITNPQADITLADGFFGFSDSYQYPFEAENELKNDLNKIKKIYKKFKKQEQKKEYNYVVNTYEREIKNNAIEAYKIREELRNLRIIQRKKKSKIKRLY